MIFEYFRNDYKWENKENNSLLFEYKYYKGYKRNLYELEFISKIIFPDMEFDKGKPIKNNENKLVGAYIVGTEKIYPNINGLHQGSSDYIVYLFLGLCESGFFMHQASYKKDMENYINELN